MQTLKRKKQYFSMIYDKYVDQIYRYCFYRVYVSETAEELTQDIFIKAWKYIFQDQRINNIKNFLYQVARTTIIDYHRKHAEQINNSQSLEATLEYRRQDANLAYDQRESLDKKIEINKLIKLIKNLPENYQEIIIMRYIQGLPPRSIAKIFQTSPKNISAKINKAKKKLYELYSLEKEQ